MKNLILIEGVSGVGKSTVTQKLGDALNRRGIQAKCYLEGDTDSPVDLFGCAYMTNADFSQLISDHPNDEALLQKNSIRGTEYVLVRYIGRNTAFTPPLLDVLKGREGFYKTEKPIPLRQYAKVYTGMLAPVCVQRAP